MNIFPATPKEQTLYFAATLLKHHRILVHQIKNDGASSPVHEFHSRVQVERQDRNVLIPVLKEFLNNTPTIKKKLALVDQRESNTVVAGSQMRRRRILKDGTTKQNARKNRRKRILHTTEFVNNSLEAGEWATLRQLFYSNKKLFVNQNTSNDIVNDACVLFNCQRNSLLICAEARGHVIGGLRYDIRNKTTTVECNSETSCSIRVGERIPPSIEEVINMVGDPKLLFILYIEKYATLFQLAQWNFHNEYNCLLITGGGCPDLATKMFMKKVATDLELPIFCLVDSDISGLEIYMQLKYGSIRMAYDSLNLVSKLYYLGISAKDLNALQSSTQEITEDEMAKIDSYLSKDWVRQDPTLMKELHNMKCVLRKGSIDTLDARLRDYLPQKLTQVMVEELISMIGQEIML